MKDEIGPIIALITFILLSVFFGYFAYDTHNQLEGTETQKSMSAKIRDAKEDLLRLENTRDFLRGQISTIQREIRVQHDQYTFNSNLFQSYTEQHQRRNVLGVLADKYDQQAMDLSEAISKLKNNTLSGVTKEISEVNTTMSKDVQEKIAAKEAATSRTNQLKEETASTKVKYKESMNGVQIRMAEQKSILEDLTQRDVERADVLKEKDGQVVLSDPALNLVIINLGTAAGVKNGFWFECFGLRPNNTKIHKGYLKVQHASASKSECVIVRRLLAMPKDPLSDYVAHEPEEMYSPYQRGKGNLAQPLSANTRLTEMGFDWENPIVEGDYIQNPFFSPDRTLTFYIAGARELSETQSQKGAIRYRWTEIKSVLEFYGCNVSPFPDINVNYVIAQKDPRKVAKVALGSDAEQASYERAIELGIPVIYEWELFRFLESN